MDVKISGVGNASGRKLKGFQNIRIFLYKYSTCGMQKDKSDADNNRRKWNNLGITQKIPQQHTGTARNKEVHSAHTAGSITVKV
jgi:hypothetical protein